MTDDRGHGPLVAPLVWLGVTRATSERVDRFVGGLTFCFFPAAPVFWLIGHFVGGSRLLFGIWLAMLAWFIRLSWRHAKSRGLYSPGKSQSNEIANRAPRYVPLVLGVAGLAGTICIVLFWPTPNSAGLYWIRDAIGGVLAWYGIWNFKVAIFATDAQIERAAAGEVDVWKEKSSAFSIKDILFVFAVLAVVVLAAVAINLVIHSF